MGVGGNKHLYPPGPIETLVNWHSKLSEEKIALSADRKANKTAMCIVLDQFLVTEYKYSTCMLQR